MRGVESRIVVVASIYVSCCVQMRSCQYRLAKLQSTGTPLNFLNSPYIHCHDSASAPPRCGHTHRLRAGEVAGPKAEYCDGVWLALAIHDQRHGDPRPVEWVCEPPAAAIPGPASQAGALTLSLRLPVGLLIVNIAVQPTCTQHRPS